MTDICALSAAQYAAGRSPIEVAEVAITSLLLVRDAAARRSPDLPPLPAWPTTDDEALARKIIGGLLDAGWTPPTDTAITEAARRSNTRREQLRQWRESLTDEQRATVLEHYSQTGEYPPACQPPPAAT